MSIKAYEPSIKLCLVHDNKATAHLTKDELSLFDSFKIADPADYTINGQTQYQRLKLCLDKYTPFENTLYIDVDTLWFPKKKVSDLIEHLSGFDFYIGKNAEHKSGDKKVAVNGYTYWEDPEKIAQYFKLKNPLPQTISGVFWFKQCAFTKALFARSLVIYGDKFAPCAKWANGKPDEYCFNVALSEMNYSQRNCHLVYFDKANGQISREQMFLNFWGVAAGGNRLSDAVRLLYNDLVNLYHKAMPMPVKRLHVDKVAVIKERRKY